MSVYFIGVGSGAVKIGHARNPYQRVVQLQPAAVEPLKLLAFVEGSKDAEQGFHERFAALHIRGELFRLTGPLRSLIAGLPSPPKSWRIHLQETFQRRLALLSVGNEIVFDDPRELASTFSDFLQASVAAERKGVWITKRGSEGERDYTRRVLMLAKQKYVYQPKLNKAAGGKAVTIPMLQKRFPGGSGRPSGWRRGQKRSD